MSDSKFCPNCGQPIKKLDAEFCPNCGHKLSQTKLSRKEFQSQQANDLAQPVANQQQVTTNSVHRPMKKRNKILLICLGVLVIAFAAFYAWGSNHYQKITKLVRLRQV